MQEKNNKMHKRRNDIRKLLHRQQGVTLAELLVVLSLLSILFGFFLRCFVFSMEQYQYRTAFLELQDNLAIAIDLIASDVAEGTAVLDCNEEKLSLQKGARKVYYDLGTDLQATEHFYDLEGKILYRRESTQWNRQPMANFISRFAIIYYDSNGAVTERADKVAVIEVVLESQWKQSMIQQRQILRLKDSDYL